MSTIKTVFGCDLRTLALFRICLGSLIIADLISRGRDLRAHYTDFGILPRAELIGSELSQGPSLHLIGGSVASQAILFLVAGMIAVCLILGYRTRLATLLSWILLFSLQSRNVQILQGGDGLLLLLLFWSLFLPLGARFSVDAALDASEHRAPNAYFSMATMALLIQCMSVYFFSALLKSDDVWIPDGTAVYYALHADYLVTSFGVWLRQFEPVLQGLTYYVWWLELLGPFLIFSPIFHLPLRLATQLMFICMHIGFIFTLEIGLFPFISITSLLAFTPGWVWDSLGRRLRTPERAGMRIYYDGGCEFCRKTCLLLRSFLLFRDVPIIPAQDVPEIHRIMQDEYTWVVVDHDGSKHRRWNAVLAVLRRSHLFWPLAYPLSWRGLQVIGDRLYEAIANNRDRLGMLAATFLPYRRLSVELPRAAGVAVAALMLFVIYLNVSTLPALADEMPLPRSAAFVADSLRLRQYWGVFAPSPPKVDGWIVLRGEVLDGTPVDAYDLRYGEPSFEKPALVSRTFSSYRWRKYLVRLALAENQKYRPLYAAYVCRRWNEKHTRDERLASLRMYFMLEKTRLSYEPPEVERMLLMKHACSS